MRPYLRSSGATPPTDVLSIIILKLQIIKYDYTSSTNKTILSIYQQSILASSISSRQYTVCIYHCSV
jgi:hypothetical protein